MLKKQFFALRNIVENCIKCNSHLFINFVDFRKAFDSIRRDTLWTVIRHYGLPQKIVSLIKLFYERVECGVILKESVLDFFGEKTGVRQDMSDFLARNHLKFGVARQNKFRANSDNN